MDDSTGAFALNSGDKKRARIFTIGHSNRSLEELIRLLKEFEIHLLVDIRRYPRSGKFPHFNRKALHQQLAAEGIEYLWLEALGGYRHSGENTSSPNGGITSPGFRNYADHMMTDDFRRAIHKLLSLAEKSSTTIMCAEKFYWKCHRRLLSDYLLAQDVDVMHIIEEAQISSHKLTSGAVITAGSFVIYPAADSKMPVERPLFNLRRGD